MIERGTDARIRQSLVASVLIQGMHIYQRAVTQIVRDFDGLCIHFQGSKLHALFYRSGRRGPLYHPANIGRKLATQAMLFQLALKDFVQTIFNQSFPYDFTVAGGTDLGNKLSIGNNKLVLAVSIFADVSGLTRYIDAAKSERDKQTALRVFHAIRKEMAVVIKSDYHGLRVQYQGDRVQGLFHLPEGTDYHQARGRCMLDS